MKYYNKNLILDNYYENLIIINSINIKLNNYNINSFGIYLLWF